MQELSTTPKHILIANKFRDLLASGAIHPGEQLMPDTELAKQYGVNKKTVANGMAILSKEGLLERAPGRGTIVLRNEILQPRRNAVGLIMLSQGHLFKSLSQKINEALVKRKLYPVLINNDIFHTALSSGDKSLLVSLLENIINDNPFGLIVDGDEMIPFDFLESNLRRSGSLVFVLHYQREKLMEKARYVLIDHEAGGRELAKYLVANAHRRITFFPGAEQTKVGYVGSPQQQIMRGMKKVCLEAGVEFIDEVPTRLMAGEDIDSVIRECFKDPRKAPPTAAGCTYDFLAYDKIMPRLCAQGINIPDDVSIVGFYNTPWAEKAQPRLTSFDIQESTIAYVAMEMLLNETHKLKVLITPTIVERESVAPYNG